MTLPRQIVSAAAGALLLCAFILVSTDPGRAQEPEGNFGIGIPSVFVPKYLSFRSAQLASATPDVMRVSLGDVRELSRSVIDILGTAAIDLSAGSFEVSVSKLTPLQTYTVWLVDQSQSEPPLPDVAVGLVTFLAAGPSALLSGVLPLNLPLGFTIDRVVVAPGATFGGPPLAMGLVNVFQKAFFRRLSLVDDSSGVVLFEETTLPPPLFVLVPPLEFETAASSTSASSGSSGRSVNLDKQISKGAQLFFEETFRGNGRTCGTCHPASNNFTIDAGFVASLPANDPLFVAEFNPALAELERPQLMRSFALILENLDGLIDPTNKFVMRGVPHTLGMPMSLDPDPTQVPTPAEMTGWSGDGSPGTGSLREFAIGAVIQHFTRRIARVEGRDFRLPKDMELDAMEAFQLSLGRAADFDLSRITFNDSAVEAGRSLFINGTRDPNAGGTCNFCHANAGANALIGGNGNFNTNVENVVHPARSVENFPPDGGFGRTDNGDGTFGNRAFNTAPVVEAADTPPFFHNHLVDTLEGVVDFYNGPEFNLPRPPTARFNFSQTQRDQLVDFMRGINTLQNIDVASRELHEILANRRDPRKEQDRRLQTALDDTQDAIDVLTEGGLFPVAIDRLTEARSLIAQARHSGDAGQRRTLVTQAIGKLGEARAEVAATS